MDRSAAIDLVRGYYVCIDEDRYDRLAGMLVPEFLQVRSDRRFEGRDAFLAFMERERPITDTTHELHTIFTPVDDAAREVVAAHGELRHPDGRRLFGFVDIHEFEGDRIARLTTYTD